MIVVPGHICQAELENLAQDVADLGIHLLGGGHCNELLATEVNDIVLLEGGTALAGYAHATFQFDTVSDTVLSVEYGVRSNSGGTADPVVESIVMRWQEEADAELNRSIGYSDQGWRAAAKKCSRSSPRRGCGLIRQPMWPLPMWAACGPICRRARFRWLMWWGDAV